MTQSPFIIGLEAWLTVASIALGLIANWVVKNQGVIDTVIETIKGIKDKAQTHDDQIAANTQAIHATALLVTPSPVFPVNQSTGQAPVKPIQ